MPLLNATSRGPRGDSHKNPVATWERAERLTSRGARARHLRAPGRAAPPFSGAGAGGGAPAPTPPDTLPPAHHDTQRVCLQTGDTRASPVSASRDRHGRLGRARPRGFQARPPRQPAKPAVARRTDARPGRSVSPHTHGEQPPCRAHTRNRRRFCLPRAPPAATALTSVARHRRGRSARALPTSPWPARAGAGKGTGTRAPRLVLGPGSKRERTKPAG